jgi:hypothetical protein
MKAFIRLTRSPLSEAVLVPDCDDYIGSTLAELEIPLPGTDSELPQRSDYNHADGPVYRDVPIRFEHSGHYV